MTWPAARTALAIGLLAVAIAACTSSGGTTQTSRATVQLVGKQGDLEVGGNGVVFDAKRGLVLTNSHVVAGLSHLTARLAGGAEVPARVLGSAPCDDTAVVKLQHVPAGTGSVSLGRADGLARGDRLRAFGYPERDEGAGDNSPGGKLRTDPVVASEGTVTAPHVAVEPDNSMPRFPSAIQHSAPLYRWGSGGPVVDAQGRLIGLSTVGDEARISGQSFAISIDHIRPLLPDLTAGRNRAYAGWDIVPFSSLSLRDVFEATGFASPEVGIAVDQDMADRGVDGVFVYGVDARSPAEESGVAGGDLITAINGSPVTTVEEVCEVVRPLRPGTAVRVEGFRFTPPDAAASTSLRRSDPGGTADPVERKLWQVVVE